MPISGSSSVSSSVNAVAVRAAARKDLQGGARVFQDHLATDGGDGAVFAQLVDAVGAARAGAEDFEDDDRPGDEAVIRGMRMAAFMA
jgi:hypothetical protein